jgi:hypothetical protein
LDAAPVTGRGRDERADLVGGQQGCLGDADREARTEQRLPHPNDGAGQAARLAAQHCEDDLQHEQTHDHRQRDRGDDGDVGPEPLGVQVDPRRGVQSG